MRLPWVNPRIPPADGAVAGGISSISDGSGVSSEEAFEAREYGGAEPGGGVLGEAKPHGVCGTNEGNASEKA
jgi:hypothetical protein